MRVALRRAFRVCGSQKHFIERFNAELVRRGRKPVTKQAVSWWASEGTFVDERYWRAFEVVTDYAVTRRHLRPDMYRDE